MNPIIGICTNYLHDGRIASKLSMGTKEQDYNLLAADYIRSVERAGGMPLILPLMTDKAMLLNFAKSGLDGIIFSGGADVSPLLYGEDPLRGLGGLWPQRDRQEIFLARTLIEETKIPILGICRGQQLINVALGGTLYQDLASQLPDSIKHSASSAPKAEPVHKVRLVAGTDTAALFGSETLAVNSFHHQAVKDVADSLRVTMLASDGVIEGLEGKSRAHLLTVQWHPEMMTDEDASYLLLFKTLVDWAGAYRQSRIQG